MAGRPPGASATDRARRLIAIIPRLGPGQELSIPQLAAELGTSAEGLFDDLVLLSMCGVWPYSPDELVDICPDDETLTVSGGAHPPAMPAVRLSRAEARAFATALELCGRDANDPLTGRLLAAAAGRTATDAADLTTSVRAACAPGGLAAIHETLASAVDTHVAVRITYFTAHRGETTQRVIQPWALRNVRGAWYVTAHCELAGAARVFRLDRIESAERTDTSFVPPSDAGNALAEGIVDFGGVPVAEVVFAAGTQHLDTRDLPGATFEGQPDGSILARIPYLSPDWLARTVIGRLGSAVVVAPAEARRAILERAETLAEELLGYSQTIADRIPGDSPEEDA